MRSVGRAVGFSLVLSCLVAVGGSRAYAAAPGAEQQIEALEAQMRTAALKRDARFFESILAADFVHTGPSGEQISKTEMIADYTSGALSYETLERGDTKIRVFGDTAVGTERELMKGSFRNHYFSGRYRIMRVWTRQQDRWVVAASQATFLVELGEADEGGGDK
jgi:hypothetical protein